MNHLKVILIFLSTLALSFYNGAIQAQSPIKDSIRLGKQVWSTMNLDVATFRNGDPIPEVQSQKDWQKASDDEKPASCHHRGRSGTGKYGKLYNWYTVHDSRGLAPKGWHIPTEAEWDTLINYLGGDSIAGRKMKNSPGFSALANGYRAGYGFLYNDDEAYFWSVTEGPHKENQNSEALAFSLLFHEFLGGGGITFTGIKVSYDKIEHKYSDKACGYSVRCIKD